MYSKDKIILILSVKLAYSFYVWILLLLGSDHLLFVFLNALFSQLIISLLQIDMAHNLELMHTYDQLSFVGSICHAHHAQKH